MADLNDKITEATSPSVDSIIAYDECSDGLYRAVPFRLYSRKVYNIMIYKRIMYSDNIYILLTAHLYGVI